jgi:Heavy-metal resistance
MHIHQEEDVMRTTGMLVGLAVMLGLAMPVAAAPLDMAPSASEVVQAAPEMLLADSGGMGPGGHRPGMPGMQGMPGMPGMQGMPGPGSQGGWQRGMGHRMGHRRPSLVGILLMNRDKIGLTPQQVDSLRNLGMDSRRASIRRRADLQLARLDLMSLRFSDPVDMGKIEAKVREIEKLKGDGAIARIRTTEAAKAQLTAEQKEKLKSLRPMRGEPRRGSGEGGAEDTAASEDES